jgi:hypothetical protein
MYLQPPKKRPTPVDFSTRSTCSKTRKDIVFLRTLSLLTLYVKGLPPDLVRVIMSRVYRLRYEDFCDLYSEGTPLTLGYYERDHSYSFWFYLKNDEFDLMQDKHKLLFSVRNGDIFDVDMDNEIITVSIDKRINLMCISAVTTCRRRVTSTIEYIPFCRWINIHSVKYKMKPRTYV